MTNFIDKTMMDDELMKLDEYFKTRELTVAEVTFLCKELESFKRGETVAMLINKGVY